MPYIFGKLWHLAIIWAIRKAFQCILQGVRFFLANHTRLSPTSENDSYPELWVHFWLNNKLLSTMKNTNIWTFELFNLPALSLWSTMLLQIGRSRTWRIETNHCFTIYIPLEPHYHPLLNNPIEISDDETLTDEFANWTLPFSLWWWLIDWSKVK